MEKNITLDAQEVRLKVHAGCQRLYKMQFRRELLHDVFKLKKLEKYIKGGKVDADDEVIAQIDFELFSNLLWLFAKAGDKTIPAPLKWEEQFTCIPIRETLPIVMELLTVLLDTVKKN